MFLTVPSNIPYLYIILAKNRGIAEKTIILWKHDSLWERNQLKRKKYKCAKKIESTIVISCVRRSIYVCTLFLAECDVYVYFFSIFLHTLVVSISLKSRYVCNVIIKKCTYIYVRKYLDIYFFCKTSSLFVAWLVLPHIYTANCVWKVFPLIWIRNRGGGGGEKNAFFASSRKKYAWWNYIFLLLYFFRLLCTALFYWIYFFSLFVKNMSQVIDSEERILFHESWIYIKWFTTFF